MDVPSCSNKYIRIDSGSDSGEGKTLETSTILDKNFGTLC